MSSFSYKTEWQVGTDDKTGRKYEQNTKIHIGIQIKLLSSPFLGIGLPGTSRIFG
jgi:hypothetical protein